MRERQANTTPGSLQPSPHAPAEERVSRPPINRLERLAASVSGGSTAEIQASILNRATDSRPWQAPHFLLQLQRQYGNRYVRRVLALARQEGETAVAPEVESGIERARGGGQVLDTGVRLQMESAFGADFSGVRVHADTEAHSMNEAVNALAFTTGQDIFFREGAYNPSSSAGRELLAHELTHVVQQNDSSIQEKLAVGEGGDQAEQEANQVARQVTSALAHGPLSKEEYLSCSEYSRPLKREAGALMEPQSQDDDAGGPSARVSVIGSASGGLRNPLPNLQQRCRIRRVKRLLALHNSSKDCLRRQDVDGQGDGSQSSDGSATATNAQAGQSAGTVQLLALISDIERFQSDVGSAIGAPSPSDQQAFYTVSSSLDRLREVANGSDEDLKLSVISGFSPSALEQAEEQIPAQYSGDSSALAGDGGPPATLAAKRLNLRRAADYAQGKGVPGPISIQQKTSKGIIHRQAAEAVAGALITFEASGGAEAEAATGPPGWVVGAAVGLVILGALWMASRGRGNVADTGIMGEANDLIAAGRATEICAALAILLAAAQAAGDTGRIRRIQTTQKAKGCRHSRDL